MTGHATVIRGNALDLPLPDASVDAVITSPPFFGLRSYTDGGVHYAGQIGDEATPAEFVDALVAATAEMVRVVKPSGSIFVNLGDKYAGAPSGPRTTGPAEGRAFASATFQERNPRAAGVPAKSLIGIPWRYALRCIDDLGLILRAEIVWSKPNGLPESVTDRVRRSHEQWFHFTREPRYFSAVDEVREAYSPNTASFVAMKSRWTANLIGTIEGQPHNGNPGLVSQSMNPLGKLPGSVWTIPTQPLQVPAHLGVDHFAAFPMAWPRQLIRGWTPHGVCVGCGEGRRPVSERTVAQPTENSIRLGRSLQMDARGVTHGFARSTLGQSAGDTVIVGYECACGRQEGETWKPHFLSNGSATTTGGPATTAHGASAIAPISVTTSAGVPATAPPTRPAVVLDPFGGTGTTATVAKALGRHGITVDLSADYCRIARWRTNDSRELARAAEREYTPPRVEIPGQDTLFGDALPA